MRIAYGYRVKETNDPFLTDVEIAVEQFSLSTAPGGFLVNLVPSRAYLFDVICRDVLPNSWTVQHVPAWFPGAGFKHTAALWAESLVNMVEQPYQFVKQQMVGKQIFLSHFSLNALLPLRLQELHRHPLRLASSRSRRRPPPTKSTKSNGPQLHYIRVVRIRQVLFFPDQCRT